MQVEKGLRPIRQPRAAGAKQQSSDATVAADAAVLAESAFVAADGGATDQNV
jgi:hypothetical protein